MFATTSHITRAVLLVILFSALCSCSKKLRFIQSSVVPAAQGKIKIKRDNNKNYAINIDIQNLAEAERLQPAKKVYVAWIETNENRSRNIGQLKSSNGLFSSKLKASLNTVTSFEPVRVFITAENEGDISYPYGETVLTTKKF